MSGLHDPKALLKRGLTELSQGNAAAATASFEAALAVLPDLLLAVKALSQAYYMEGRYAAAVGAAERVLATEPGDPANYLNHGICLFGAGRLTDAAASFARGMSAKQTTLQHKLMWLYSLTRSGAYDAAFEVLAHVRASGTSSPELDILECELRHKSNAWGDFDALLAKVREAARLPGGLIAPSMVVGTPTLTGTDHRRIADSWMARVCAGVAPLPPAKIRADGRIRLGYLSPDFKRPHPVGRHMEKVIAAHDRAGFEVVGYALRPKHDPSAEMYEAFDDIHFVGPLGDASVAKKIRDDGIEILVDLGVHTDGARPRILAFRPAPVQVNFIGHCGPMGGTVMDYMITFGALMSAAAPGDFTEAPAAHADPFLNGAWDRPDPAPVSRRELGIAEETVLFCSFCANYKITPDIFDLWLRLLNETPGSVLWLRDFGPSAKANLMARAQTAGVGPQQFLFAENDIPARFFGRLQCADLFLDTAPYSAGSSATDALWAGLPIVTLAGETYVSTMAASCLVASGLPELVTTSREQYLAKALELAKNRGMRERYRAHLLETRATNPLFDVEGYTRRLESLYRQMSRRHRAGERPSPLSA